MPTAWYSDPAHHEVAEQWGMKGRKTIKAGDTTKKVAVYNNSRAGMETAEELWGSKVTAHNLQEIKNKLGPASMFQSFRVI
jgi:LPS sulfotransferase NodH